MKCVICKNEIEVQPTTGWDKGHNAEPVKKGRCCDGCNSAIVIPCRLELSQLFI